MEQLARSAATAGYEYRRNKLDDVPLANVSYDLRRKCLNTRCQAIARSVKAQSKGRTILRYIHNFNYARVTTSWQLGPAGH
eukprot:6199488-Pleurochrysis_carterae.AAC.5